MSRKRSFDATSNVSQFTYMTNVQRYLEEKTTYAQLLGITEDDFKKKQLKLYPDIYKVAFYSLLKEKVKKNKISEKEQAEYVHEAIFVGVLQLFFIYGI